MDKIILADDTAYEIKEGASLGNVPIVVEKFADIKNMVAKFTDENLKKVKFVHNEDVSGEYENLTNASPYSIEENTDKTYTVHIALRTKTELEKKVDAIAEACEMNAAAIETVLTDVIPGTEA